jgi:hypothetical protein
LRIVDALTRVGLVPAGQIATLYMDADVTAARVLNSTRPSREDCWHVAAELAGVHQVDERTITFTYGLAIGIRQRLTFAPPPAARSKWISEEYKQLAEPDRRDVQRYIPKLLKVQTPPQAASPRARDELAAAREWTRAAGRLARSR